MMYYRRKVILALLQAWGGKLANTDFQKILFLLCQRQNKPAFDFVPYKFGAFSFQSYSDKRTMEKQDLLVQAEDWKVKTDQDFLGLLNKDDRQSIYSLKSELKDLNSKALIKYVYKHFPYYAVNSEIAAKLMSKSEYAEINKCRPKYTESTLFTIGYEGRSFDSFLNTLIVNNISLLCDVRKNSFSMKYGFSKKQLKGACEKLNIKFMHIPQLGIESDKRRKLETQDDYNRLFEEYEKSTLKEQRGELDNLHLIIKKHNRIALMCFEKLPQQCHRGRVASAMQNMTDFKFPVLHL